MLSCTAVLCSSVTLKAVEYSCEAIAVIAITAVNLALPWVLRKMGPLERHRTQSSEARSTMQALFTMYFLNSAISYVLANCFIPSSSSSNFFLLGSYSDLTPSWFQVGYENL